MGRSGERREGSAARVGNTGKIAPISFAFFAGWEDGKHAFARETGGLFGMMRFASPLEIQKQIPAIDFTLPNLSKLSDARRTIAAGQPALRIRTFWGCAGKAVLASELLSTSLAFRGL